jgi:NADH-quinone oxidoreductase subunit M
MAFFMVFFIMASVGLPGTNGFIGEFLTVLAAFSSPHLPRIYSVLAISGMVLGALYLLRLASTILFGPLLYPAVPEHGEDHRTVHPKYVTGGDITGREVLVLIPLMLLSIGLGVRPGPMLQSMVNPVQDILSGKIEPTESVIHTVAPATKPVLTEGGIG